MVVGGEVNVRLKGVKPGSGNSIHSDNIRQKETIFQIESDDKR